MQNSHPPPFSFCLVDRPRDVFLCARNIIDHNQHSHRNHDVSLHANTSGSSGLPFVLYEIKAMKSWRRRLSGSEIEFATPCLSRSCEVPEFWFRLPLSGLNNFSQDRRARGQPAGQVGTVAAVSDRQRLPPCVCYRPVSNTCLDCDKYLLVVSLQLPAGLAMKHNCSRCLMLFEDQRQLGFFFFFSPWQNRNRTENSLKLETYFKPYDVSFSFLLKQVSPNISDWAHWHNKNAIKWLQN